MTDKIMVEPLFPPPVILKHPHQLKTPMAASQQYDELLNCRHWFYANIIIIFCLIYFPTLPLYRESDITVKRVIIAKFLGAAGCTYIGK